MKKSDCGSGRSKRIRRSIFLAAVFLMTAGGLQAGTVTGYGEVYVSDSFYNWDLGADSGPDSPQAGRSSDQDSMTGPGVSAQVQNGDKTGSSGGGPSVTQVTLTEKYHEEYKVYEESLEDMFFFYTNVSNGGITDKQVILDIPQNMFCTMEKDGALVDYIPGQPVSDYGTYVARLTGIEDPNVPFSEQKEYRAVFRFRIQEKPPQTEEESQSQGASGIGYQVDWGSYASQAEESSSGFGVSGPGSTELSSETSGVLEGEEESSESLEEETLGEEEETESDSETSPSEESGSEDSQAAAGRPGGGSVFRPRTQVYDSGLRRYEVTFENGRTLSANIPEGYTGPGAVEFSVSQGEDVILYCNDEAAEYVPGNSITEPGYYRLDVDGQMWSFTIAPAVKNMDYYLAPAGMELTEASLDGEPVELVSSRYLFMEADGEYQIAMKGNDGEGLQVALKKDTVPPDISVSVKGGRADIQYLSDDTAQIILEKDGEIQEGFAGYVVNSPGSYKLTVTDVAGNVTGREFNLKYQVNKYGILAVVLVILLIAGGVVFVFHVKKTVKVR